MLSSRLLFRVARFLLIVCILSTTYLYLYPFFRGCAFPSPRPAGDCSRATSKHDPARCAALPPTAPFRLLAFGDPQLEGDSSLPKPTDTLFPSLGRFRSGGEHEEDEDGLTLALVRGALSDLVRKDIPRLLQSYRKRLDLFGNDYYLAHIYRTLHWWTQPTHVSVLGDLLGSQWISDEEFASRGWRFWQRVFRGATRVEDERMVEPYTTEVLGDDPDWGKRIINIAGNHDIGYAGDIDKVRVERFERMFGKVNWEISFTLPNGSHGEAPEVIPRLRIVVLNSMNIDTPALSNELQQETYAFINGVISRSLPVEDASHATLLLTHIPLYKEEGICVDGPFFSYFSDDRGNGIKEQNHLSEHGSKGILEGIFGKSGDLGAPAQGMGRRGVIVNGHDHEGCDVYHYHPRGEGEKWKAVRWTKDIETNLTDSNGMPGLREVTLRAMMGEYGGNAGLLSAWWDGQAWRFELAKCAFGVQHWWWAVHVADLVTLGVWIAAFGLRALERRKRDAQITNAPVRKEEVKKD